MVHQYIDKKITNKAVSSAMLSFIKKRQDQEAKGLPKDTFENFSQLMLLNHGYTVDDLEPILKTFGLRITPDYELRRIKEDKAL